MQTSALKGVTSHEDIIQQIDKLFSHINTDEIIIIEKDGRIIIEFARLFYEKLVKISMLYVLNNPGIAHFYENTTDPDNLYDFLEYRTENMLIFDMPSYKKFCETLPVQASVDINYDSDDDDGIDIFPISYFKIYIMFDSRLLNTFHGFLAKTLSWYRGKNDSKVSLFDPFKNQNISVDVCLGNLLTIFWNNGFKINFPSKHGNNINLGMDLDQYMRLEKIASLYNITHPKTHDTIENNLSDFLYNIVSKKHIGCVPDEFEAEYDDEVDRQHMSGSIPSKNPIEVVSFDERFFYVNLSFHVIHLQRFEELLIDTFTNYNKPKKITISIKKGLTFKK